jgi:hypothetical protein
VRRGLGLPLTLTLEFPCATPDTSSFPCRRYSRRRTVKVLAAGIYKLEWGSTENTTAVTYDGWQLS